MVVLANVAEERRQRERAAGTWADRFIDGYVNAAAVQVRSQVALVDGDVQLTYGQLDIAINSVAGRLLELGIDKGDVVSWQLPNWHESYMLHHAVIRLGAVSNPIVPTNRHREVEYILAQAKSKVVVIPETFRAFDYAEMINELRSGLPDLQHVVVARPVNSVPTLSFEHLRQHSGGVPTVDRSPDDAVLLMFTSGTTARPKGVVHTHNTLDYENRSIIEVYGLTEEDRVWMPSPVTHVTGMLYGLQLPAMLRNMVVLQDIWEPGVGLRLIADNRCTFTVAATPFLHGLTYHPQLDSFDISSLRVFACGGADVPPGLIREARRRLSCYVTRVYGSTEFPTLSTTGPNDFADKAADTDGHAIAAATYRLINGKDADVAVGAIGELLVRGPEALAGYQDPADEQGAFTDDGWFRTGDLATYDAEGYVTIRGRKKDIILRGGENISVTEVESLLFEHPMVTEIAIVAMPDPILVERACAFVVPSSVGVPTLVGFAEFLGAKGVSKQKFPERLEIVSELPKTQSGKVQKFRLREDVRAMVQKEQEAGERLAPIDNGCGN
jgi:cyclohexanecarboxylate-CoA ligase